MAHQCNANSTKFKSIVNITSMNHCEYQVHWNHKYMFVFFLKPIYSRLQFIMCDVLHIFTTMISSTKPQDNLYIYPFWKSNGNKHYQSYQKILIKLRLLKSPKKKYIYMISINNHDYWKMIRDLSFKFDWIFLWMIATLLTLKNSLNKHC